MQSSPPGESSPSAYYCRVGQLGFVGKFRSAALKAWSRGDSVVVRTSRGIELGEVLSEADFLVESVGGNLDVDGKILRSTSVQDRRLMDELIDAATAIVPECEGLLRVRGLDDFLIDIEPLLDSKTVYFYFAGAPSERIESLLSEFASAFERRVQQGKLARLIEVGCGPDCGTHEASGCSSDGGCASCIVAKACRR